MIGLGSNRLTVCRRGGMSVTQAGRGGMEWLGVRGPSWASPYSAQATAALKAQFPTQWPTIRDYGVAHPEIVGYMNAYAPEDAKIAYSLVPTLGVVRLISTTAAGPYINLEIAPTETTEVELRIITTAQPGYWRQIFGCSSLGIVQSAVNNYVFLHGGNSNRTNRSSAQNKDEILRTGKTYCSTSTAGQATISGRNIASSTKMQLFRCNGWSDPLPITSFIYCKIWDNGVAAREMYPFIRKINGVDTCGMIDVLSGTFYQNAGSGSFTISETPAS